MITIEAPTKCPSCSGVVEWVKDQIYCRNASCPAQSSKKVEHFAKTMKIKGLGPATIAKLCLVDIVEIYTYTEDDIAGGLGSVKLAEKLLLEIENSTKASLNRLLPAFSIPLVGNSAAKKLAAVCDSIFDIDATTCKQAGLGEKTTNNLLEFIDYNYDLISELPFSFNFEKPRSSGSNGIVCISGRLKSYKTKAEATGILESLGYTVKASLTKDVTILINESGVESAKTQKARTSGITIVTNLKDFIGEINK
jgi:DNA ligase (NAD+)